MTKVPISPEAAAILENRRREVTAVLGEVAAAHPVITLELGCGHGHFLTAYAGAHPGQYCVGIDQQANRITRSLRKQNHAGLPNLLFVRAEVGQFLECLPVSLRLDRVFVLFPDPWPKRRHHKNRLLRPAMLDQLAGHALPGATLHLRTDDFDYLDWAAEQIEDSNYWQVESGCPWPFEFETVFQSKAAAFRSLSAVRADPARRERRTAR